MKIYPHIHAIATRIALGRLLHCSVTAIVGPEALGAPSSCNVTPRNGFLSLRHANKATDLHFENVSSGVVIEWYGHTFVSGRWQGFTFAPSEAKTIDFHIVPHSIWEQIHDFDNRDDRWSIDLSEGSYRVWHEFEVNGKYHCRDSRCKFKHLEELAAKDASTVWTGQVRSDEIKITHRQQEDEAADGR